MCLHQEQAASATGAPMIVAGMLYSGLLTAQSKVSLKKFA
jgi:hypothetical protein